MKVIFQHSKVGLFFKRRSKVAGSLIECEKSQFLIIKAQFWFTLGDCWPQTI